jgi:membrane fusion protein (multidrug efflux system)
MSRRWSVMTVSLSALVIAACSEVPETTAEPRAAAERSVPVIAERLRFERARTRAEAVGTSRAAVSAEIYPATSGEVIRVNFEPGQFVREGEALIELDQRKEKLAVEQAALQLEDAERLYDRYRRSAGSGAVLPTTLDAARTAVEQRSDWRIERLRLLSTALQGRPTSIPATALHPIRR